MAARDRDPGDPLARFRVGVESATAVLVMQGAMGWLMRGDLERAAKALGRCSPEVLRAGSVAAAALSSLCDEVAAGRRSAEGS